MKCKHYRKIHGGGEIKCADCGAPISIASMIGMTPEREKEFKEQFDADAAEALAGLWDTT